MRAWMWGSPTRGEVVLIAMILAFVFAVCAGLGAEHAAKAYADRIVERMRSGE